MRIVIAACLLLFTNQLHAQDWLMATFFKSGIPDAQFVADSLKHIMRQSHGSVTNDFKYTDLGKHTIDSLVAYRGKTVLLNFWQTTCPPCVEELPALSKIQRDFREKGLVVVFLSPEDSTRQAAFFAKHKFAIDGIRGRMAYSAYPAPYQYSINPCTFLIDKSGVIRDSWMGALSYEAMRERVLNVP